MRRRRNLQRKFSPGLYLRWYGDKLNIPTHWYGEAIREWQYETEQSLALGQHREAQIGAWVVELLRGMALGLQTFPTAIQAALMILFRRCPDHLREKDERCNFWEHRLQGGKVWKIPKYIKESRIPNPWDDLSQMDDESLREEIKYFRKLIKKQPDLLHQPFRHIRKRLVNYTPQQVFDEYDRRPRLTAGDLIEVDRGAQFEEPNPPKNR